MNIAVLCECCQKDIDFLHAVETQTGYKCIDCCGGLFRKRYDTQ